MPYASATSPRSLQYRRAGSGRVDATHLKPSDGPRQQGERVGKGSHTHDARRLRETRVVVAKRVRSARGARSFTCPGGGRPERRTRQQVAVRTMARQRVADPVPRHDGPEEAPSRRIVAGEPRRGRPCSINRTGCRRRRPAGKPGSHSLMRSVRSTAARRSAHASHTRQHDPRTLHQQQQAVEPCEVQGARGRVRRVSR